ncbi:DivIVA domain-containing protein, partial [bacterium]
MRIRASNIHEQTFSVSFRGFDPKEVDEFLDKVAQEIERLVDEKAALEASLAKEKDDRLKLEEALASSRDLQKTIIDHARREAHLIEERANHEAQRMIGDARNLVDGYLRDIEVLREKRITFLAEMAAMSEGMREWVERQPAEPGPSVAEIEERARSKAPQIKSFEEIAQSEEPAFEPEEEEADETEEEKGSPSPFDLSPPSFGSDPSPKSPSAFSTEEPEPLSAEPSPRHSSSL